MAAIDLEQIKAGLKAVSAAQGFPELIQHHGFAHGGIVGALADDACAWAAAPVLGDAVTSG